MKMSRGVLAQFMLLALWTAAMLPADAVTSSGNPTTGTAATTAAAAATTTIISAPTPSPPASTTQPPSRNIHTQLDSNLFYLYDMVEFILEDIIQTNYLTEMNQYLDETVAIGSQFTTNWQQWIIYVIGFTVCVAIGIVLCIGMLLVGPMMAYFRSCCGTCGAKRPCCGCRRKPSCVGCSMVLLVVMAGVLFGAVPMFLLNERVNDQIEGQYFANIDGGLEKTINYIGAAVAEMDDVIYDGYVLTETEVFAMLDEVPNDVMKIFENLTGIMTAVKQLATFTAQLLPLQGNLTVANSTAASLVEQTADLEVELQTVLSNINATLFTYCDPTTADCSQAMDMVSEVKIATNFSVVNVTGAILAVNYAIMTDLPASVQNISQQLANIPTQINASMAPSVSSAKAESAKVKQDIASTIDSFNTTLTEPIVDFRATIQTISTDPLVDTIAVAVYWSVIGLISVVIAIAAFNIVGVFLGAILPHVVQEQPGDKERNKNKKNESKSCCDKSVGSTFLVVGSALTLIFYWLLALLVAVVFAAGGLVHTEVCRHVVGFNQPKSMEVLGIFDRYVAELVEVNPNYKLRPFQIYANCSVNASLYMALDLDQNPDWDLTKYNYSQIQDIVDEVKSTDVSIPPIDVSTQTLNETLAYLDVALGSLNFTELYASVNVSIVQPSLDDLIAELRTLNMTQLENSIQALENITENTLPPMEKQQQQLVSSLEAVEAIIGNLSFADISVSLAAAETAINTEGEVVASEYINKTADTMYVMMTGFLNETAYAVENDVARCEPLYDAVTVILDANCVTALYPVNGMWCSLAWSVVFLLPSVILAMNLSTIFRQLKPAHGSSHTTGSSTKQHHDADYISSSSSPPAAAGGYVNPVFVTDSSRVVLPNGDVISSSHAKSSAPPTSPGYNASSAAPCRISVIFPPDYD